MEKKSSSPNQLKLIQLKKNSNNKHLSLKKQKNQIERGRKLFEIPFRNYYYNEFNITKISNNKNEKNIKRNISKKSLLKRNKTRRRKSINDSYSNYSNSSSCSSREYRKKKSNIFNDNSEFRDYPSRKDVGLNSSEDEDSIDYSILEDNNFSSEIERILIEIYNKNISIISSNNNNDIFKNKKGNEIIGIEKQFNSYLKKLNVKCNLLVLKILSDKIRELISKYKEKILEIPEVKRIYDKWLKKKEKNKFEKLSLKIKNWINDIYNSSFELNNLNELQYENLFIKNTMILKPNEELTEKGITHVLLRELINIQKTLKISSKEIENIFKYPLSLLKDDLTGKQNYFSIEKIQLEEFDKIILKNEFISLVLLQIKVIFGQLKISEITKLIDEVEKYKENHNNEKTKFDEFLLLKLKENLESKINKNNSNYYLLLNSKENNNEIINLNSKETLATLNSSSSVESVLEKNEINNNNNFNNNIENNINNNINDNFKDLDELVKYISEGENEIKKPKKKKNKKKKNKKIEDIEEKKSENYNDEDDQELINAKRDLEKSSVYYYSFNKIKPILSKEFLEKLKQ